MLRAGPIHIAVIDAAPQCTFHHDELHLAQPFSGIVVALVGLLRILRVSELSASPRPAPTAPEKPTSCARSAGKDHVHLSFVLEYPPTDIPSILAFSLPLS